jgi:copper(I)-binding protein
MTPALTLLLAILTGAFGPAGDVPQGPGSHRTAADADIVVRDAWVRESTSLRTSSSGYCRIENRTARPVALVKVTVDGVKDTQVHTTVDQQGQATMRSVTRLTIPAHASVDLAPGGTHLMLTGIPRPLHVGDSIAVRLTFDDGRTRQARAIVRPLSAVSVR